MRNFKEFQAARRHVSDLAMQVNICPEYFVGDDGVVRRQAGYVYDDGTLYIEDNGDTVYLLLGRDDWTADKARLAELELQLYAWACGEFYDGEPEDSDAAQVACAFVRVLREWIKPVDFDAMRAANAKEENPHVCHSHDYCDANEAMLRAFAWEGHDTDKSALWLDAWAMAGAMLGRAA